MANETKVSAKIVFSKGGLRLEDSSDFSKDVAGDDGVKKSQNIGTSSELVDFGDISGIPGTVFIKNLDDTNFVELGGDSGLTVFKTKVSPGEFMIFEPQSATLYAKADTAAVRILVLAVEP